jgi:site-specific DNA-methyltransferase (adenine-specific)
VTNKIIFADCLTALQTLPEASVDLIYIDPPFNTGKVQTRKTIKTDQDITGERLGFGDKRYTASILSTLSFQDNLADYHSWLLTRIHAAKRVLKPSGSFFLHLDYREVHWMKVLLDIDVFGKDNFRNEIIWAFDYGARSKSLWPAKHNTILWYTNSKEYTFNYDAIDRIPYMAPGLVGPEKAARGKTVTSVWWQTIVGTNSKEKTGYPTQKPIKLLDRIISVHTNPGDLVLDFFAGSGTTGEAAGKLNRRFMLIDNQQTAIDICTKRLKNYTPELINL